MNRKIFVSLFSIAVMAVMVGAVTYAYFSDSGTSSGNVFSTGTLDLRLSDSDQSVQDSVSASFGSTTLVPGSCTSVQTLNLRNSGTVNANHVEVTLDNAASDPNMAKYLRIASLTYDGVNVLGQITFDNGNGFTDLEDWDLDTTALDNLALTNLNTNHALDLNVCLDSSAGNDLQGDNVTATFTTTLNQDSSQ